MVLVKAKKTEIIESFKVHNKDTGSAKVQIGILTERINQLTGHFKAHKKDHDSRHGLLKLVGKRRKLLDYLRRSDEKTYLDLIKKLDLRK